MRPIHVMSLALAVAAVACEREPITGSPSAARVAASDPTPASITLQKIGSFAGAGIAAAEITAFDHVSRRLFVVNGLLGTVDVLDLKDPSNPIRIASLSVAGLGASANSVAASNGIVAVAIEATTKTS